jgi:hypothetical protein
MNICGQNKMVADQVIDTCTTVPLRCEIVGNDTALNHVWKPISHGSAVEAMMTAFEKHGVSVVDSAFALNRTGHMIVGGFQVVGDCLPMMPANVDGVYECFFRHANDMSMSLQLNAGLSLFICTNGIMTGERIGCHKHTSGFDMDSWALDAAVPNFITACGGLDDTVADLKETPVSDADAHRLILEAGDQGILPLARTVDVYREWHEPTFAKSDFEPGTAWKLYNDFTFVSQKCSPQRQHQIIEQVYSLITANLMRGLALAG